MLSGFKVSQHIYHSHNTEVLRAIREVDRQPVILKVRNDTNAIDHRSNLEQEFSLIRTLEGNYITTYLEIRHQDHKTLLVIKDDKMTSLSSCIPAVGFQISYFIDLAIEIATAIASIHAQSVIHKDINPSNIVTNSALTEIKLIDFELSSQISEEVVGFDPPSILQGTLPYISPEQTGRINKPIDLRSDLYSLGMTFYQMLTGKLPFEKHSPGDLIYSHIAQTPKLVSELRSDIPPAISNVIDKLLRKSPDERYQTAEGIREDLIVIRDALMNNRSLFNFKPGQKELSHRIMLTGKLYGRNDEVAELFSTFKCCSDAGQLVTVTGSAGIGKTALIRELYAPITTQKGFFLSGKFDQLNSNMAYTGLAEALRDFVRQCCGQADDVIAKWNTAIKSSVANLGSVLLDIIPEFQAMIGPQPAVAQVPPLETVARRNMVFANLIYDICKIGYPIVMFLDDLQWADSETLSLLQKVLEKNPRNFMLILSYRDNELSPIHPAKYFLDQLKDQPLKVSTIHLDTLQQRAVNDWLADMLPNAGSKLSELADLIMTKTEGNPFYVTSFLHMIIDRKHIKNNSDGTLSLDIPEIAAIPADADVIKHLIRKIENLPPEVVTFLTHISILGNRFPIHKIAIFLDRKENEYQKEIQSLVAAHLLVKSREELMFAHDRIQEAALSMLDNKQALALHLQAGENTKKHLNRIGLADIQIEEYLYHYNAASELIIDPEERLNLAKLNNALGKRLKNNGAYQSAEAFFSQAIQFLPFAPFNSHYDLAIDLHKEYGHILFLNLKYEEGEKPFEQVLKHSTSPFDSAQVYIIQIEHYATHQNMVKSLDIALKSLETVGIRVPRKRLKLHTILYILKMLFKMRNVKPANLLKLPLSQDSLALSQMGLLGAASTPAYMGFPEYFPILAYWDLKITLAKGNSEMSPLSYIGYAIILCSLGDLDRGFAFGQAGIEILNKLETKRYYTKVTFLFAILVHHWKKPMCDTIELVKKSAKSGWRTGDYEFGSISISHVIQFSYYFGKNINALLSEIPDYNKTMIAFGKDRSIIETDFFHQMLLIMNKPLGDGITISGSIAKEDQIIKKLEERYDLSSLGKCFIAKLHFLYLCGQYEAALAITSRTLGYLKGMKGSVFNPLCHFFCSLVFLAYYREQKQDKSLLKKTKQSLKKLKNWGRNAPDNYLYKAQLVEAELCAISGNNMKALKLYEAAIENSSKAGNNLDLGLSCECMGRYLNRIGLHSNAQVYLHRSMNVFNSWGALQKAHSLSEEFNLTVNQETNLSKGTDTSQASQTFNAMLDLDALAETVRALTTNFDFNSLLTTLLDSVMKSSGATQVAYIHAGSGSFQVRAQKQTNDNVKTFTGDAASVTHFSLSLSVIEKCYSASSEHVLENIRQKENDENSSFKSVLVIRLMRQQTVQGLVYLENSLMENAFRPEQVQFLTLLAGQAAIAIENALAFESLNKERDYSAKIIEKSPSLICGISSHGITTFINPTIEQITGYSKDELIGKNWWKLLFPDKEYKQVKQLFKAFAAGDVVDYEMCLTCKNGEKRDVIWNSSIKRDSKNNIIDIIGFGNDITERKKAEHKLEQSNIELGKHKHHLKELVEERTRELKESQKMAIDNAHKAGMADIATGTLHNIGNILSSVKTSSQILKEKSKSKAFCALIKANDLLKENINDLKSFITGSKKGKDLMEYYLAIGDLFNKEKIETEYHINRLSAKVDIIAEVLSAQQSYASSASLSEDCNITDVIEDVLIMQQANFSKNHIRIEKHFNEIVNTTIQKTKLVHILVNLIINALEAMKNTPEEKRKITISTRKREDAVVVTFKDNGSGILPGNLTKIFNHGFTTKPNGHGFGLHSCANYMTEMNGKMSVESDGAGKGASFTLEFPISY